MKATSLLEFYPLDPSLSSTSILHVLIISLLHMKELYYSTYNIVSVAGCHSNMQEILKCSIFLLIIPLSKKYYHERLRYEKSEIKKIEEASSICTQDK